MNKSQYITKAEFRTVVREEVEEIVGSAVRQAINEICEVLADMMEKIDNRFNRVEAILPMHDLAIKQQDLCLTKLEIKSDETIKRVDKLEFSSI
jgi:hypothetical protein